MARLATFSIVAADPESGEVGVAVQSKFLAAGALVPWARGGVGAVATQAFAEVTFGPRGLDLLAEGLDSQAVLDRLLGEDPGRETRQVGIVAADGRSASFTGAECFAFAGSVTGEGYAAQGNIMATDRVVPAMGEAFEATAGTGMRLAERLVEVLRAAQREGGDKRGMEAAGLLIARPGGGYGGNHDLAVDLRVDHHDDPIEELGRILELHRLYFDRPRDEDLLTVDGGLEEEIAGLLGPATGRAARLDRASVRLGDGLGDGQPEPGPALRPRPALVGTSEPLEDPAELLCGDPGAGVRHLEHQVPAVSRRTDLDPIGFTGVLHRVLDQGVHDDAEAFAIRPDRPLRRDLRGPPRGRRGGPPAQGLRHEGLDGDGLALQEARVSGRGEQEQPVGEPRQPAELVQDDLGVLSGRSLGVGPGSARRGRGRS